MLPGDGVRLKSWEWRLDGPYDLLRRHGRIRASERASFLCVWLYAGTGPHLRERETVVCVALRTTSRS
eukprot:5033168-Prymnesium_polylepis.1